MSDHKPGPSFHDPLRCPGCNRIMTKRAFTAGIEVWDCSHCTRLWEKRRPKLPGFSGQLVISALARMRRYDWPGYRIGF